MSEQFSTVTVSRHVEWSDTDASGHQHNSFLLRMVESAERQLMVDAGIVDLYFPAAPRVRHEVDYLAKLYFQQEVTATIVLDRLGNSSMTLGFEVWGEEFMDTPRRLAAQGRVVVAHVPPGTEKATPWPDEIRNALSARG